MGREVGRDDNVVVACVMLNKCLGVKFFISAVWMLVFKACPAAFKRSSKLCDNDGMDCVNKEI